MRWKPYDLNEYSEPWKIRWFFWVFSAVLILLVCFFGQRYWAGGWDGESFTFWHETQNTLLGVLLVIFVLRLGVYYKQKIYYDAWLEKCERTEAHYKAWANRHLVCFASFTQFPGKLNPRTWLSHREQLEQFIDQALPIEFIEKDNELKSAFHYAVDGVLAELKEINRHYPVRCHVILNISEKDYPSNRYHEAFFKSLLEERLGNKGKPLIIELHPVKSDFSLFTPMFQNSVEEAHLLIVLQLGQSEQVSDALASYLLILGEYHVHKPILPGKAKFYRPQLIRENEISHDMNKFLTLLPQAQAKMPLIQSAQVNEHAQAIYSYLFNAQSMPTELSVLSAYTGTLGRLSDLLTLGFLLEIAEATPKQLLLANAFEPEGYLGYIEQMKAH
ncbi:hypothetical protein [Thorsellia kenyensis]|uniref:Uncharacterized protein n=1 Tax=Thorsellia kenyensis TaxID=1549888 RepID=A0ABV6C9F4_9GAMM